MARKSIGSLVAKLLLQDLDFTTKLERASKKTETEGKKMERLLTNVGTVAKVAFGAISASLAVRAIKNTADETANLKRQTDRIGTSLPQWAAYEVAAAKVGTTLGAVDGAIQNLKKSSMDASLGDMSKLAAFDKLNLDVEKFAMLNPDEKFRTTVDALNKLPNSAQAAAIAQELLGTSFEDTFAILQMGTKEMNAAAVQADNLGLALSDIDAQKVLDASRGMERVHQSAEGLARQLSADLSPAISEISGLIIKQINEWGGIKAISRTVLQGIVTGVGVALQVFDGFELVWHLMKAGLYGIATVSSAVSLVIAGVIEAAVNLGISSINTLIKAVNTVKKTNIQEIAQISAMTDFFTTAVEVNAGLSKEEWGKAMAVLDKPPATDRVIHWFDEVADKWTDVATAEQKATEAGRRFGEVVSSRFDRTAQSIQKVKLLLLSLDTVAEKGGHSVNAQLARRAVRYQAKAEEFEARGQFGLSDQYRRMSRELGGKVNRRQQTEEMQLDSAQKKAGPITVPVSDEQRAADLHRQADLAYKQRRFVDAVRLNEEAKKLDRVNSGRKPKVPSAATGAGRPEGGKGAGNGATTTPAHVASTPTDSRGDLISQIQELIATLNALPGKVGLA